MAILNQRLSLVAQKNKGDKRFVCKHLYQYNVDRTGGVLKQTDNSISLYLKDDAGNVMGGILANTFLYCLYIDVLWIDESIRGKGYGRDLMLEVERMAKEGGCTFAHTTTFSFQAPDFYQRMGYQIFGVIDDYPGEIKQFFLKKKL